MILVQFDIIILLVEFCLRTFIFIWFWTVALALNHKVIVNVEHNYLISFSFFQEKRVREIVLKAMGQAISKTVAIAEIIKVDSAAVRKYSSFYMFSKSD